MSRCVNERCSNDPMSSLNAICVSVDGDFACCEECKKEYEKQRDRFFNQIIMSPDLTIAYLLGKDLPA